MTLDMAIVSQTWNKKNMNKISKAFLEATTSKLQTSSYKRI